MTIRFNLFSTYFLSHFLAQEKQNSPNFTGSQICDSEHYCQQLSSFIPFCLSSTERTTNSFLTDSSTTVLLFLSVVGVLHKCFIAIWSLKIIKTNFYPSLTVQVPYGEINSNSRTYYQFITMFVHATHAFSIQMNWINDRGKVSNLGFSEYSQK